MMRKRVLIVNLQHVYREVRSISIPYVYGTLRIFAEQHDDIAGNYEFLEPLCAIDSVDRMLEEVDAPDVIGFSTYVWNDRNSHALARAVKERYPACLIVFGGPHVPNHPSDYLTEHPWVDLCVHGEGEMAFTAILRQFLQPEPCWSEISGVSYLENGRQRFSAPAQRLTSLDFPSPFVAGYFDAFVARYRDQGLTVAACFETNRGCPYSCAFCDWGMATSSKLRQYPLGRVMAEFDWAASKQITRVILNDANFGILPRDVGLMEHVVKLKRETGFPQEFIALGFAKNNKDRTFEINRLLQDNQLEAVHNVNFSLQATNQPTLDAIHRQNIPLENYRDLSDRYARNGYQLIPDLIFPLPGETLDTFKAGFADLASWEHVSQIRVYPCSVLPNAPMAKPAYREEWGLKTRVAKLMPPGLDPIHPVAAEEVIEMVVETRDINGADVAEARLFIAVVNAFEIFRLTRFLRRVVTRMHGIAVHSFYDRFIEWQRTHSSLFTRLLRDIFRDALANDEYCEELDWVGECRTMDFHVLRPHKALTYTAMVLAPQFHDNLKTFLIHGLGLPCTDVLEEALRFQADLWLTPSYEPRTYTFHYDHDWIAFLEHADRPLERRPLTVRYPPRPRLLQANYAPGRNDWMIHLLNPLRPETSCCHDETLRQLEVSPKTL